MAITAARCDLSFRDSGDLYDAFQFGTVGDTSWSFDNKTFHMDVKGSNDDSTVLLSLTTANGGIVVANGGQRVLYLYVAQALYAAALVPGCYVYDLIMIDNITTVRTPLLDGNIEIKHGTTQE